jgi:hypothetical protein
MALLLLLTCHPLHCMEQQPQQDPARRQHVQNVALSMGNGGLD